MERIPQIRLKRRRGRPDSYSIHVAGRRHYLGSDEAEAYRRAGEIIARHHRFGTHTPVTLNEVIARWNAVNGKVWQRHMIRLLHEWAGTEPLANIQADILDKFVGHLERKRCGPKGKRKGYSPETIRKAVLYAHRLLTWALDAGWLAVVPSRPKLRKAAAVPRDITPTQLKRLFRDLGKSPRLVRATRILRFMAVTGCRPGEACSLEWDQVDLDHGTCHLAKHKTAIKGKARTIYLTPEALAVLGDVPGRRDGHVFTSSRHKPYTVGGLRAILKRQRVDVTPHRLRHTFAQIALETYPLEVVALLLGHSDLQTAAGYAQIRDRRAREAAADLTIIARVPPPKR